MQAGGALINIEHLGVSPISETYCNRFKWVEQIIFSSFAIASLGEATKYAKKYFKERNIKWSDDGL